MRNSLSEYSDTLVQTKNNYTAVLTSLINSESYLEQCKLNVDIYAYQYIYIINPKHNLIYTYIIFRCDIKLLHLEVDAQFGV